MKIIYLLFVVGTMLVASKDSGILDPIEDEIDDSESRQDLRTLTMMLRGKNGVCSYSICLNSIAREYFEFYKAQNIYE